MCVSSCINICEENFENQEHVTCNLITVKYQYLELLGTSIKLRDTHGFENIKVPSRFQFSAFPITYKPYVIRFITFIQLGVALKNPGCSMAMSA